MLQHEQESILRLLNLQRQRFFKGEENIYGFKTH
jgi:hypothetical protein